MEKSGKIVKRACSFIRYLRVYDVRWQGKGGVGENLMTSDEKGRGVYCVTDVTV